MKLSALASQLGLKMKGDDVELIGPAPIEAAGPGLITFAVGAKYAGALRACNASAAIVPPELAPDAHCATLISSNPMFDFARALEIFFPPYRPPHIIHPSAAISSDAKIGEGASIGEFCVIGQGVTIGRNAVLHPHVVVYPRVSIGDEFTCHSHVSIREGVTIGNRVTILNGAVIGADGFGFVEHDGNLMKVPQVGSVIIEDDVEIGANTAIDRATIGATLIRRGVKLDNLIQIGHNCAVGEFSRMAAQTGLAGSVTVGKWCQFGGQSGFADHAKIGDLVRVVAQSGVPGDLAAETTVGGTPAIDVRLWRRLHAIAPRLPGLFRRVRAIEARVGLRAGRDE